MYSLGRLFAIFVRPVRCNPTASMLCSISQCIALSFADFRPLWDVNVNVSMEMKVDMFINIYLTPDGCLPLLCLSFV